MLNAGAEYQNHFIQVSYPHIRQSLEFFQVRQALTLIHKWHLERNHSRFPGSDLPCDLLTW